jgi:predicted Zn-dependent protease
LSFGSESRKMKKTPVLLLCLLAMPLLSQAPQTLPKPQSPPTVEQPSSRLDQSVQEALQLARAGKAAVALEKLRALAKDPAATPPVLSLIGALYLQLNKPQEALAVLKPIADRDEAEPAVLYNAGRAALLTGDVDEGRVYLTRSVLKEPASPAARDLGFLTARDGRVVEAYSMLRPWALRNPGDTDARVMAASLALQLERPDAAEELLAGLPESDPAVRLLRGKVLVQKKDGPGAMALLQPLFANHPPGMELEVRRTLAEAELVAGRPVEAVKLLEGHAGNQPALVLLLARAQHQAGNAVAAMATLKPLADKLPQTGAPGDPRPAAGIALEYGTLLLEAGKPQEAGPFLERSTLYNPRNPEAWKALARALEASGRKADAQHALAEGAEAAKPPGKPAAAKPEAAAAPQTPAAMPLLPVRPIGEGLQKALRLMGQKQLEPALAAVRQEIGISKVPDPRARILEVRLLLGLKRNDEALKLTDTLLKDEPNNADYVYLRGASEMALARLGAAEQDLRKSLQLAPNHTGAMNDLAVLLMELNKKEEAQRLLEQVLRINPQDQMAAANLQRLKSEGKP